MNLIALELDDDRILVATARVANNRARIQHAFSVDITRASDEQAAEALRAALAEHRTGKGDALVVVKRSSVEIRELDLPPAPENELPDMVRFLARSEFASLNDHWLLDFIPLSIASDSGTAENAPRKVLASGLSPERLKKITAITEGAGLKLKHILLRPFESYSLLRSQLQANKRTLIVDLGASQVDMILSVDRNVVATRTVRITGEDQSAQAQHILAEIKRTVVSSESVIGNQRIDEVILLGDTPIDEQVAAGIRERLAVDVKVVKPFDLVDIDAQQKPTGDAAQYSALLGSLLQQSAGTRHAIDYLNPRKPVVKTSGRRKLIIYGSLAASIVALATAFGAWILYSQSAEIAEQERKLLALVELNKGNNERLGVDQILGEVRAIDDWKVASYNWLDELFEYSERFLTPDDAIIDTFDATVRDRTPSMTVKGRVSTETRNRLYNSLQTRPYEIISNRWDAPDKDPSYPEPYDFRVSFTVNQDEIVKSIDQQAEDHFQQQRQARTEQ